MIKSLVIAGDLRYLDWGQWPILRCASRLTSRDAHPITPDRGSYCGGMARSRVLYADHRPCVVSDSLEELSGPVAGVVELPPHRDWSEQGRYDLATCGSLP